MMCLWYPVAMVLMAGCLGVSGQSAVIIDPVKSTGVEACLVVIPGAELRGESYRPLAEAVQKESRLRLWVALTTDYTNNLPNPIELPFAINEALTGLRDAGMAEDAAVFFAGHSLGGTYLQSYVDRNPQSARGAMLWASYLTGNTASLAAYPTPIMHLSGDLDGQVRITRIAGTFRELEDIMHHHDSKAVATKPVVVVEGVNHFQFSSGEAPPAVERGDIPSDISSEEAWSRLALVIKDFIAYNAGVDTEGAFSGLTEEFQQTHAKMAPLTAAKTMEWNGTASSWLKPAQELVAAFPENLQTPVTIYSIGYTDQGEFESSKPTIVQGSDGIAVIAVRGLVEFPPNPVDFSSIMDSGEEIAAKLKNQEAIERIVGEQGWGESASCRQINEEAFSYAYTTSPDIVKSRYDTRGRPLIFGDDLETLTGSQWVDSHVTYETLLDADDSLLVTSSRLYTNVGFPSASIAGMHYCKLMSPYRAMEWMYVDSLRPV